MADWRDVRGASASEEQRRAKTAVRALPGLKVLVAAVLLFIGILPNTPAPAPTRSAVHAPAMRRTSVAISNANATPSAIPHIMVIDEENKDALAANLPAGNKRYILGNPEAPYLNQLAAKYASATNWYALQHPSLKTYLALESGQTIANASVAHTSATLVDQLVTAGIPWTAYIDGLNFPGAPSSCDPNPKNQEVYDDVSPYYYEWDHNPFWWFTNDTSTSECKNVVPYPGSTSLLSTLNGPSAPDFVWVSPNGCNDGHDANCQYVETESADLWLQGTTKVEGVTPTLSCPLYCLDLPSILASSWYKSGGIIIITWDEAPSTDTLGGGLPNTNGGQIATLVISSSSSGAFTSAGNQFGILRAIEEKYGLPLLANAANLANGDLIGAFGAATTGAISGTVTDSLTHAAIVGATVSYSGGSATTDSTGTYTLSNVPNGPVQVTPAATGYATQAASTVTVTAGSTVTKNFVLTPNPGTITGVVTDSVTHAGIVGAAVSCTGTPTCTGTATTTGGAFTLSNLTEGTYQVAVSATNYGTQTLPVAVKPGATTPQNYALVPGAGSITGVVTDSVTHAAIVGASVSCTGTPTCAGTTTGPGPNPAAGTYTLSSLTEGTYQVTVTAANYTSQTLTVNVTPGTSTSQNFAMVGLSGGISGKVTDSVTHAGLFPAKVSYTGPGASSGTTNTTDAAGDFGLTMLPEGSYQVTASATNYTAQTVTVTVSPGATTAQSFALVGQPGSISGTVTSDGVTPISGATIACTGTLTCSSATSAPDGTYTLTALTEGTYQVTASATGFGSQTLTVTVTPGATTTGQNFTLPPGPGSIAGTVTDSATTNPIAGAAVSCTPTCGTTTTTDGSGNYTLNNVAPGTYTVSASANGYASGSNTNVVVTTGNQASANIALVPNPGAISGTVTDSTTSANIVGASVSCTGTPTCTGTTTSSGGAFTLSSLSPGTYSVTVSATNYTSKTLSVTVSPGATTTQNFALVGLSGAISGTVTDSVTHAGLFPATVSYIGPGNSTGTTNTSDSAGDYALTMLPEGSYQVTASATNYTSQTVTVSVNPGATTPRSFALVSSGGHQPVFSDGFESGNLSLWSKTVGMTVVGSPVHTGTHAAQGIAPSGTTGAYAYKTLPSTYATGYARVWFYIASNTGQINLLRVRSSTSTAYVLVKSTGVLALNNGGTGSISSTTTVTKGAWHELELSVTAGTSSSDTVWLDGNVVTALTGAAAFGAAPIQTVQIGEASSETWNVVFDDAAFDTQILP